MKDMRSEECSLIYRKHLIRSRTKGIIFKLKQNSISGNQLELLVSFLKDRMQRVALTGQVYNWADVTVRVPQGSILGPLLDLI